MRRVLRERPLIWSVLLVLAANLLVFWSLSAAASGCDAALKHQHDRICGLSWALDGAVAPAAAVVACRRHGTCGCRWFEAPAPRRECLRVRFAFAI